MAKIDVIVPVHSTERPLVRCVTSVLDGVEASVRVIVVAHNITVEQARVALGGAADDERVEIVQLADGIAGPSTPKNYGLDVAESEFVGFLDSDDELQPGAIDRWLAVAEDPLSPADFVIANRREPDGTNAPSPPVRLGRRRRLDGVKDRLPYRAAPLGLMRRSNFGHLRFREGVHTGEDIAFSAAMWFSGALVSFAFGEPGYLVHADQQERLTTATRSIDEELKWMGEVLDPSQPWMRRPKQRRVLLVKILRQNIPDALLSRLPDAWDSGSDAQLSRHVRRIWSIDASAFNYLSRAEWKLIDAIMRGGSAPERLQELLAARGKIRSLNGLLSQDPLKVLSAQSPLRFHLGGVALARAKGTRRRGTETHTEVAPVDLARSSGTAKGRMVFHAPFPVKEGATSASGIRPWKMLQAFKDSGYEVFEITGYASERRRRFASLKKRMRAGWVPDFVYSEAATIPSSFTEPKHFPLTLNLERQIFRYLHERGVPSGVFYRDVYWAFPDYQRSVGRPIAAAMRKLYAREVTTFNRFVDVVFLPTTQMGPFIPGLRGPRQVALPPGCDVNVVPQHQGVGHISLLYVGAVGGHHYDIGALLDAVQETPGATLTICTRTDQWAAAIEKDPRLLGERIHVVHESGSGLEALYEKADIACLVMKPQEYRSFAAPMKLYEYLGHGKPVLVSQNTHAADVVEKTGAGWVVPFECDALAKLLDTLARNPGEVEGAALAAATAGSLNTWQERVKTVAEALGSADQTPKREGHVLVIPSWYPKDAADIHGSFFREQAEAMQRAGWDIGVVALELDPLYRPGHQSQAPFTIEEENGIGVVRGTATSYFPMQRRLNTLLLRRRLFSAFEIYVSRFGKPDVLHAHSLYPGAFFAAELSKRYGLPLVYTEHRTLHHLPARTAVSKRVETAVARRAKSRHGVSRGHAEHMSKRFGGAPFEYTPNLLPAVSSERELGGEAHEPGSNTAYTFGHMSNFDRVKRVDAVVDAFAEIWRSDSSVRLVIGGAGQAELAVRQQVEELGIEEAVSFLGYLERDEVADFYASIDCFVLPSTTEPMGVVQIEALAAGVPLVSTRTWGGSTVVEEGDGLLVDIGNHDQLVAAMRKMKDSPSTRGEREARRQRCIDRFGECSFVERYRNIYLDAMSK